MDPDSVAPFTRSYKDGYFHVDCAVDKMETLADKFGDERHKYDEEAGFTGRGNVSIVRYEDHVDREELELMTGRVCFNFCRSVPNMTFFGLIHGRHCYCMPYFLKDGKGGQGTCDLGCEGDTSEICGGLKTTSVYAMHNCANTEEDLSSSLAALGAEAGKVALAGANGRALAEEMEAVANALMDHVIEPGDMLAHANGQSSKVFAGKVLHAAEAAEVAANDLASLASALTGYQGKDFTVAQNAMDAEFALDKAAAAIPDAAAKRHAAEEYISQVRPALGNTTLSGELFAPILFAFDELKANYSNTSVPNSCEGKYTGAPMTNLTFNECAEACNGFAPKDSLAYCAAFQFYDAGHSGELQSSICLLFRELIKVDYFDCPEEIRDQPSAFLQKKADYAFTTVGCYGKQDYLDSAPKIELEEHSSCWGLAEA
jgi:hypothetical protein